MSRAVEVALARALADIIVAIEQTDDEVIAPEVSADIVDPVTAIFDELSNTDRHQIAQLILEYAKEQRDPARKRIMQEVPDGMGLLDDD